MNGVTLDTRTDMDIIEFRLVDFEIEAVINCAPWFNVLPLPLPFQIDKSITVIFFKQASDSGCQSEKA